MDPGINNAFVAIPTAVATAAPRALGVHSSHLTKRVFDFVVAGIIILAISPLLLLVAAVLLVVQGRPICFAHHRIGKDGRRFPCFKFRTMVVDSERVLEQHLNSCPEAREEWDRTRKLQRDPRVTALGAALRASSVDELPQLLNVLWGHMSLVGPRPIVDEELPLYGAYAHKYLDVRPGLTGAWQVNGRSTTSFADRVKMDVDYVDTRDLIKDVWIIARTIPVVLLSKGAV